MALEEYSGGRKRRKRSVLTARSTRLAPRKRVVRSSRPKRVVKRRSTYEGGAKRVARRKPLTTGTRRVSRLGTARPADAKRRYGRIKGKPRGDVSGAKYVGKRIKEESAKKGRKLTRIELSKLFKDAWAEYKARKGK